MRFVRGIGFSGNAKQRRVAKRRFERMNPAYTLAGYLWWGIGSYRVLIDEVVL